VSDARHPDRYRPDFAPHVMGEIEPRSWDQEDGRWEDQRVEARCEKCGATLRAVCRSGKPRQWVVKFALVHLHRDPLSPA